MLLVDNINFLKNNYYSLWQQWEQYRQENKLDSHLIEVENSRKGVKTLVVKDNEKSFYLHSKYDPVREAGVLLEGYKDINENTTVIFYGAGLGYHITAFTQKHPNVDFYICEPVPEVFEQYISHGELAKLPLRRIKDIVLADTEQKMIDFFNGVVNRLNGHTVIVELPSYKTAFADQHSKFQELFKKFVRDKRSSLHTNYAFQKRWILNSIKNFKEVLNTPNIIMEKKGAFAGQPALLVAAGPSLDEEIEHVRHIKDNGLAYIFSVGSAINTLVENNIYPHAACTYDPTVNNQKVFAKVVERGIKEIPMIFGSSVGYETLEKYPGPKYHMLTSQDTVSQYFLRSKDGQAIQGVYDAPTIAVVTLQLLYRLGFNPIILVGQNLAYRDKKRHSAGVDYSTGVTEDEIKNGLWVKDVSGQQVLTNEGFNRMRLQMEMYIEKLPDVKIINTTQGGADIKGAPFVPLEEAISKNLKDKTTIPDWLPSRDESNYDIDYLMSQLKKMNEAYIKLQKIMAQITQLLKKVRSLAVSGNFKQLNKMYNKLDNAANKMLENHYFKVFIKPMNRVYYDILSKETANIREEKEPRLKAEKVINSFGKFLHVCRKDMQGIDDVYKEIKQVIVGME